MTTNEGTNGEGATDEGAADDEGTESVESTPEQLLEMVRKKDQENKKLKAAGKADAKELERLRKIEDDAKSESEKAVDDARKEGRAEAEAEYQSRLLAERIMRRATGKLADPSDVILIDFTSIDDPEDPKQIDAAIDDLLEAKPHLAAGDGSSNDDPPLNPFEQGPRGRVTKGKLTAGQQAEKWLRNQF